MRSANMSQKIGPREQALRDMRAKEATRAAIAKPARAALAAGLPTTSGKKPVKKKRKAKP
jgi:hypothetical protein